MEMKQTINLPRSISYNFKLYAIHISYRITQDWAHYYVTCHVTTMIYEPAFRDFHSDAKFSPYFQVHIIHSTY